MERPSTGKSYVDAFPAEIWAEIFQHALRIPAIEAPFDQTRVTQHDVPISVSQVCTRFRQISTNLPRLWSTVVVDFSAPSWNSNPDSPLSFTRLWLDRSKTAPLFVFLYNIVGSDMAQLDDGNDSERKKCLVMLFSHVRRWKQAALRWRSVDSDFWSSMEVQPFTPLLESLYLSPRVEETMMEKGILPDALWSDSPCLQRLVVLLDVEVEDDDEYYPPEDDKYSAWAISYGIPYTQLTHLNLSACSHEIISRQELLTIFQLASNLVCCFVQWIAGPEPETIPTPILLEHLRHLYLEPAESTDTHYNIMASQLVDYITAPSLLSLTLVRQGFWVSGPFKSFIQRSGCALEELNLIAIEFIKVAEIYECLQLTSDSLRRIHFGRLSSVDEDLYVKTLTDVNPTTREYELCPKLEQLSLASYPVAFYGHPPPFSLITRVLKFRMQPPQGVSKRFKTLLIPETSARQIPADLRKLCEDPFGLDIKLHSYEMLERDALWERFAYD